MATSARFSAEEWNMEPEEHIRRAAELAEVEPQAGEVIAFYMQDMAIASRHAVIGIVGLAAKLEELRTELRAMLD